jgi:alkylation response protein AidB-like acyl-CoA dehydrogenase
MTAIAFDIPEEIRAARDGLLTFGEKEVLKRHNQYSDLLSDPRKTFDESGRFNEPVIALIKEVRMASANAGYYHMCVPEALGGAGLGHLAYYVCWEALFRSLGPTNWLLVYALAHWAFGPSRLLEKMTSEAQKRILPTLMNGSESMCFGLSEPNAGSDATMIKTRAEKTATGWKLNGRKIWTSNAPIADYCVIFAVTDPDKVSQKKGGISAFVVPTSSPGFHLQRVIRLFGHIGGDEAELVFEDLEVEPWQLLGDINQGFNAALYGVSLGRIYNSARSVGYGRWALNLALDYAGTREAFGSTIDKNQGVTFPLAESATELHAAHLMGINAACLLDSDQLAVKELSMTKAFSVQVGFRAIDQAIQTHGGMGLTNELGLTEAWHTLRIINIADGTNEILNRTIAQRLLKGDREL